MLMEASTEPAFYYEILTEKACVLTAFDYLRSKISFAAYSYTGASSKQWQK
jgi:hypothetical protein